MTLDQIKARYDYDAAGYAGFVAFHKSRKHSTADIMQSHEYRLHNDISVLLKLIENLEKEILQLKEDAQCRN